MSQPWVRWLPLGNWWADSCVPPLQGSKCLIWTFLTGMVWCVRKLPRKLLGVLSFVLGAYLFGYARAMLCWPLGCFVGWSAFWSGGILPLPVLVV